MLRTTIIAALVLSVVSSAVSLIYVKHEGRKQFVALQQLAAERDVLQARWSQLQLEHSAWATHDRVETQAHKRLSLHAPAIDSMVLVTR